MPIYYQARISAVAGSSITIYSEKLNSGDTLYLNFLEPLLFLYSGKRRILLPNFSSLLDASAWDTQIDHELHFVSRAFKIDIKDPPPRYLPKLPILEPRLWQNHNEFSGNFFFYGQLRPYSATRSSSDAYSVGQFLPKWPFCKTRSLILEPRSWLNLNYFW